MTEYTICAVKWASSISMHLVWPLCVCVAPSHHGWERKRKTGGQCDWNCMQSNAAGTWAQQPPDSVCAMDMLSVNMLLVVFASVFLLLVELANIRWANDFLVGNVMPMNMHLLLLYTHTHIGRIKNIFWHFGRIEHRWLESHKKCVEK